MYQLQWIGNPPKISEHAVTHLEEKKSIPFDPDNTDYQAYLKWLSEGNTPLPPPTDETSQ